MDVLVVVGVGRMGEAVARRVGGAHHTLVADFNRNALDTVAGKLEADGFTVTVATVDVSDRSSVDAVAAPADSLGRVIAR